MRAYLGASVAVAPAASFTVTTTVDEPGVVGVPEITPAGEIARPVGNPVALKVYGARPPVAPSAAVE